ncbi:endonuclease [bacterium]|nr:endonuclease [bacterium]
MTRFAFSAVVATLALLLATTAQAQTRIRLMAGNITSGNNQSYDPGHGTRIFQAFAPDVAMIQEMNYGNNSTTDIRTWINTAFGTNYSYFRESGAQIPNGIASKYPIIASGEWTDTNVSNRDYAWARIDIPGDKDLWAISVHLLTTSSGNRNAEANELKSYIQANVPAGDYVVIGGDFNTDNTSEAAFSTLSAVVKTSAPYPADQSGNRNTNAGRSKPYDHVLVSTNLDAYQVAVQQGSNSHPNGLVFDSRVYSPLSAVSPVQSGDSGATNMQHMAIIKDFLIPEGGTGGTSFTVSGNAVNFGTGLDVASAPFTNSSIQLTVAQSFQITGLAITGADASQFAVTSPNLSSLPATISASTPITFRWTPLANDGATRNATATFNTNGSPASFAIALSGSMKTTTNNGGGEGPVYFQEDFEATSLSGSYTTGNFSASSGTWGANSVILESASASCDGVAARINDDTANAYVQSPALTQGIGTISFKFRELNSGGGTMEIQTAASSAGPFTTVGSQVFGGTTCATASISVRETGTRYFRIVNNNQAGHLIIDTLTVTSFEELPEVSPSGWLVK